MVAALLLVPLAACGDDDDDAWDTFTSDAHQYSIDFPPGWTVTDNASGDDDTITAPDDPDTTVLIEFGLGPDADISAAELSDTVVEAAEGHYDADPVVVLGEEQRGGKRALVVEWTTTDSYGLQAWVPNGDSSWYVTMTTSAGTKGDYDDTFRQMLDSFEPSE